MFKGINSILLLALLFAGSAFGQIAPRVAGLENNYRYLDLLQEEQDLHVREDSITRIIAQTREMLSAEENGQQKFGNTILSLEGDLFDVRNQIGMVTNDINRIEQEFVIRNFEDQGAVKPTVAAIPEKPQGTGVRNLILNHHFKQHLSAEEYTALKRAQELEPLVDELVTNYTSSYGTLKTLADKYQTATNAKDAEAIYQKYNTLTALNVLMADSLAQVWNYVYDNKSYVYTYLLDKMNRTDLLTDFERRFTDLRQKEGQMNALDMVSNVVVSYPLRKRFLLASEQKLADVLGYSLALDSINQQVANFAALRYDLPKIVLEERVFIDYADVAISSPSKYNTKNPIPLNIVYNKGTVYKIQVGTFTTRPSLATFRGVSPLSYEQLPDQRYRYYAGAFAERVEADEALALLKRAGFRRPEVVVWRDGVYENLTTPMVVPAVTSDALFRVAITSHNEILSEELNDLIQKQAPNKEVARTIEADSYLFTVGTFDSRAQAEQLSLALQQAGVQASVQTLEE